jgi:hypothetical protein
MNQLRVIATAQFAGAAVAFIVALLVGWSAYSRWEGISHINSARSRLVDANDESVKRNTSAAAAALPSYPAAVLLDIDPTKDADYERLERLERKCPANDRPLVRTAQAMSLVMRGKPAPDIDGADGVLLKTLAALGHGAKPTAIVLPKESAPHHALLVLAYAAQLRAAFAANDRALVRDAAGMLAPLLPASTEGFRLSLICGALDPDCEAPMLDRIAQRIPKPDARVDVLRRLAALAPDRAAMLDGLALGVSPTLPQAEWLTAVINAAGSQPGIADPATLARLCFDAGRPDLAKPLIAKLPADIQPAFRSQILSQAGDVAELAKLAEPALAPRITPPRFRPGQLSFHLSNDLGMVPKTDVLVKLNGTEVPAARLTRIGTLYSIETSLPGPAQLEVSAGGTGIFSGPVAASGEVSP